jgi:hypothetical protein
MPAPVVAVTVAAWLAALAPTLARQVLLALGFGFVTYVGLDLAITGAMNAAKGSLGTMGAFPAAIIAMSGMNTAMGIVAGAVVTRLSFVQLKKLVPK